MNNKEMAKNDVKKERIQASLEKKKSCFRKAKECVEILLENNISESSLLEKLQYLSQADYQDVVEERAILKICGYAVCSSVLKSIPTKQYQISTISNKVYDITERKNFCSSRCYKASCYLKEQIPTSPVWLRDDEDLSGIHLLPSTHVQCQPGVEVTLSLEKVTIDDNKKQATQSIVSMFACDALEELKGMGGKIFESLCIVEQTIIQQKHKSNENAPNIPEKIESASSENTNSPHICENVQSSGNSNSSLLNENFRTQEPFNEIPKLSVDQYSEEPKENLSKSLKNVLGHAKTSKPPSIPPKSPQDATPSMSSKNKLPENRKIVTKNVQLGECPDRASSKSHNLRIEFVEKSVREWFSPDSMNYLAGETKPSPPQPEVQNPVSEEEIKVQAFYSAGLTKQDVSDKTIPVVEKYEQRTARQKIVFEKLSKILPEIVIILGLNDVTSELRSLVETFTLEAHNVMMRPSEWNLVALIILQMLSKMNASLNTSLTSKKSKNRLSIMLRSLQLEDKYLDTFVEQLFNNAAKISAALNQ